MSPDVPPTSALAAPFRRHLSRLVPQWRSDGDEHAGPATEPDGANDLVLAEACQRRQQLGLIAVHPATTRAEELAARKK